MTRFRFQTEFWFSISGFRHVSGNIERSFFFFFYSFNKISFLVKKLFVHTDKSIYFTIDFKKFEWKLKLGYMLIGEIKNAKI